MIEQAVWNKWITLQNNLLAHDSPVDTLLPFSGLFLNVLFSPTSYWMDHLQVFHFITVPPLKEKIEPRTANWTECICPKTWFRAQKPGKVSKTLDHVSRSPKAYPITNPATPGKPSSSQSLRMHIFHTVFQAFSMVLSVLPYLTHDR